MKRSRRVGVLHVFLLTIGAWSLIWTISNITPGRRDPMVLVVEDEPQFGAVIHASSSFEGHTSTDDVSKTDLKMHLQTLEQEITLSSHPSHDSVYIYGPILTVRKHLHKFQDIFQKLGLTIKTQRDTSISQHRVTVLRKMKVASYYCFSKDASRCLPQQVAAKFLPTNTRLNKIPFFNKVLWDKAAFCTNMKLGMGTMPTLKHFMIPCWVMPEEFKSFSNQKAELEDKDFVIKPTKAGAGRGITLASYKKFLTGFRAKTPQSIVVQTLLRPAFLVNKKRWDIRLFGLLTSAAPLRLYIFKKGLVRVASHETFAEGGTELTTESESGKLDLHAILTNTRISADDGLDLSISTHPLNVLKEYFVEQRNVSWAQAIEEIKLSVGLTFLSAELKFNEVFDANSFSCEGCFQLLGIDVMVNEDLVPRVIEVNSMPSLQLSANTSDHYSQTKLEMLAGMAAMIHKDQDVSAQLAESMSSTDLSMQKVFTRQEWVYLLHYARERIFLSGWNPVYPWKNLQQRYDEMILQHPGFSERRKSLHRMLSHIERVQPVHVDEM